MGLLQKLQQIRQGEFSGLNEAFGITRGSEHAPVDDNDCGVRGGKPSAPYTVSEEAYSDSIQLIVLGSIVFFEVIALCLNLALCLQQKSGNVGPSGLVGFSFFLLGESMLVSGVMLVITILASFGKASRARLALRQIRFRLIIAATQSLVVVLNGLLVTIAANTNGCRNASDDHNATNSQWSAKLPAFCSTRKSEAAFAWFACFAWLVFSGFALRDFKRSRNQVAIPPFDAAMQKDYAASGFEDAGAEKGEYVPVVKFSHSRPSGTYDSSNAARADPIPAQYRQVANTTSTYDDPFDRLRAQYGILATS